VTRNFVVATPQKNAIKKEEEVKDDEMIEMLSLERK
jgi:hypothetical protein